MRELVSVRINTHTCVRMREKERDSHTQTDTQENEKERQRQGGSGEREREISLGHRKCARIKGNEGEDMKTPHRRESPTEWLLLVKMTNCNS